MLVQVQDLKRLLQDLPGPGPEEAPSGPTWSSLSHMRLQLDKGALDLLLRPSLKEVLRWAESLEALLTNQCKSVFTSWVSSLSGNHGYCP